MKVVQERQRPSRGLAAFFLGTLKLSGVFDVSNAKFRRILIVVVGMALLIGSVPVLRLAAGSPSSIRLIKGVEQNLRFRIPLSLSLAPAVDGPRSSLNSVLINDLPVPASGSVQYKTPVRILPKSTGRLMVNLKLFGIIPVRRMTVDVIPAVKVVPGGQAIGVLLTCDGVVVVAHTSLEGLDGVRHYPADEAGIQVGDVINTINGEDASSTEKVRSLVAKHASTGKPLTLGIKRNGKSITKLLSPVLAKVDKRDGSAASIEYRMGLYIEDNVAGVGTLTFYSPDNGKFAALGHVITDGATNQRLAIKDGKIVRAGISGIHYGVKGQPGEKIGTFDGAGDISGKIVKNTDFGIYGTLSKCPIVASNPAVPIAVASQIHTGSADILTVVADNKVERFKVEIQKIYHQARPQTKGLVVKVVDSRLLKLTGGIIQGMSGSPILQDGRLVGAVTHVFVNDPTRGYGVLAEWMVMEAGLTRTKEQAKTTRGAA